MITVIGMDLSSYLHFQANPCINALALEGPMDNEITEDEREHDNIFAHFVRVKADDIESDLSSMGYDCHLLTMNDAEKIINEINLAIKNKRDLMVHSINNQSRLGAVIYICYKLFKVKCEKLIIDNKSILRTVINDDNFYNEYAPNTFWIKQLTKAFYRINQDTQLNNN